MNWASKLTRLHEKLLEYILVLTVANQQSNCGVRVAGASAVSLPLFTVNVLFVTRIFGKLMNKYYLVSVNVQLAKRNNAVLGVSPHERLFQEETGLTSYIERFNHTLRQRNSRLVRKTLLFSRISRQSYWCNLVCTFITIMLVGQLKSLLCMTTQKYSAFLVKK